MESTTVFASGKIYWAKVFTPVNNYEGTAKEWTFEFEPEDVSFLKEAKLLDRLKDRHEGRPDYIVLRKPELNADGEKNDPIRIYDEDNKPWDSDKLIGNGSKVDVKLRIIDWGKGKKKSIWVTAIRVTDHIPYTSNEFGAMDSTEVKKEVKKAAKPSTKASFDELDGLDDDIPF